MGKKKKGDNTSQPRGQHQKKENAPNNVENQDKGRKAPKKAKTTPKKHASKKPCCTWLTSIFLSVLAGVLVVLGSVPLNIWPFAWFALTLLLIAIEDKGFWPAFVYGLITGYVTNALGFYWVAGLLKSFGHLPVSVAVGLMVILNIYQGLSFAFAAGITAKLRKKFNFLPLVLVFPMAFTGLEFLLPFIFPWFLSNGQLHFTPFIQSFDLFGVSGGTFVIVTFSAALAAVHEAVKNKKKLPIVQLVYGIALPVLCVAYGVVRQHQLQKIVEKAPGFKVGIIEPDVGVWEKEIEGPDGKPVSIEKQELIAHSSQLRLQYLSRKLEKTQHPDLLIWPEGGYFPWWKVYSKSSNTFALAAGRLGAMESIDYKGNVSVFTNPADSQGVTLNSVAAAGDKCYAAVGTDGFIMVRDDKGQHSHSIGTDRDLLGVAVSEGCRHMVAVGEGGLMVAMQKGKWTQLSSPTTGNLRTALAVGGGFYVAGDAGTLLYVDGKRVKTMKSGTNNAIYALYWSRSKGLVLGGAGGTLIAWHKGHKRVFNTHTTTTIRGVWGQGKYIYAVGSGGWITRCNPDLSCKRVYSRTHADLYAVSGDGTGRIYAAGAKGTLLEIHGRKVKRLHNPLKNDLFSITGIPYTNAYPFPDDVKFLYRARTPLPSMSSWKDSMMAAKRDKAPMEDWSAAIRGFSTPVIIGGLTSSTESGHRKVYNTAILADGNGRVLGLYKKVKLLVFGEYLPFEKEFPFLRKYFMSAGTLSPGKSLEVFKLGKVRIGPLICYEAIIPWIPRDLAGKGVDFFVNMTNDSWFGKTAERYQHFDLSVYRTIENRKYLVRVTNTGISAVVDPFGHIVRQTKWTDADAFTSVIKRLRIHTLYQDVGDAVPYGSLFIIALLLLMPPIKLKGKSHGTVKKA